MAIKSPQTSVIFCGKIPAISPLPSVICPESVPFEQSSFTIWALSSPCLVYLQYSCEGWCVGHSYDGPGPCLSKFFTFRVSLE